MHWDLRDAPWIIAWDEAPPGWVTFWHRDVPQYLRIMVRVARTSDGLAAEAVLVERNDGRAVTARDLRDIKLPQPWMLARGQEFMRSDGDSSMITAARPGARGKSDDHWRAVFRLWARAQRVAPRTPVRWMRTKWPEDVSDATMRRWIKRARERAASQGWKEDHE
jgi:hypothetical protein